MIEPKTVEFYQNWETSFGEEFQIFKRGNTTWFFSEKSMIYSIYFNKKNSETQFLFATLYTHVWSVKYAIITSTHSTQQYLNKDDCQLSDTSKWETSSVSGQVSLGEMYKDNRWFEKLLKKALIRKKSLELVITGVETIWTAFSSLLL